MSENAEKKKIASCCNLEAIVSFDERGQIVLPKEIRKKFKLEAGTKLALISCTNGDDLCCFTLMPAESFQPIVKDVLAPVFENTFR